MFAGLACWEGRREGIQEGNRGQEAQSSVLLVGNCLLRTHGFSLSGWGGEQEDGHWEDPRARGESRCRVWGKKATTQSVEQTEPSDQSE